MRRNGDGGRAVGRPEAPPGEEERSAGNLAAPLLVADVVAEVAVEPQRDDRRHAVLLVLSKLGDNVLARIRIGAVLPAGDEPDVAVCVDEAGHDGPAAHVDHASSLGRLDLAHRADGGDAIALDHQRDVVARGLPGAVDEACSLENHCLVRLRGSRRCRRAHRCEQSVLHDTTP